MGRRQLDKEMVLVGAQNISKEFASRLLFKDLSLSIHEDDRVGLIGPNGAGKSTLLKILARKITPDQGQVSFRRNLRIGYLEQTPIFKAGDSIFQSIMTYLDPENWEHMVRAQGIIEDLSLTIFDTSSQAVHELSGGWQKRVALARELAAEPEVLLLDEPTNHLDVESILWLEDFLRTAPFAVLVITHDRVFLQNVTNRMMELNRRYPNGLLQTKGDYASFLESKELLLSGQEKSQERLTNTFRRETEWLRRGAQARQTKQQARIKSANAMGDEVQDLKSRNQNLKVRLDFASPERSPKVLVDAEGISKSFNGRSVVPLIDIKLTPTSRIGLMGPNGCGKSTLIQMLTKNLEPDTGKVFHSEKLKVSFFDQHRGSLNPELSVQETISPGGEQVVFQGQLTHVKSYLSRFLFNFEQMKAQVSKLSGGEQSRLVLAQLMLKETNFLVLDEPTNDLDMETLAVLKEMIEEFKGAVLIVTHDRYFLDQVSNQILTFGINESGEKEITKLVGLDQWNDWYDDQIILKKKLADQQQRILKQQKNQSTTKPPEKKQNQKSAQLENQIAKAENEIKKIELEISDPQLASNAQKLDELSRQLVLRQDELEKLLQSWNG